MKANRIWAVVGMVLLAFGVAIAGGGFSGGGAGGGGASAFEDLTGTAAIDQGGTGQTTATAAFDALAPTTSAGDISYHNGTDNIRLAKGTADQVLTMNAGATAPEWADAAGGGGDTIPTYGAGRRFGVWSLNGNAATLPSGIGTPSPASAGGSAAVSTAVFSTRQAVLYTSGATTGNVTGVSNFTWAYFDFGLMGSWRIGTSPTIAAMRAWVGFAPASTVETSSTPTGRLAAFRYATDQSDTTWQACTADGTTLSCTDTTVTVATSTAYELKIDCSTPGSCLFYVNDTLRVTKETNIPSGVATSVGPAAIVVTLENVAKALHVANAYFEQN